MAAMRFFNPSAPTVLITADPSTATYAQEIEIMNIHSSVEFKNNYMVPAHVTVYTCVPRITTDTGPVATITASIADQSTATSPVTAAALGLYPDDFEMLRDRWKILKTQSKVLRAGDSMHCSHNTGKYCFKPAEADLDADAYIKGVSVTYLVRLHGAVAHSNASNWGRAQAAIDFVKTNRYKVEYDSGGVALEDISYTDSLSFMATAYTGAVPIPDNVVYDAA